MFQYSKNKSGFTLTELMVSISIVVIILTVVVSNQTTYTDGVSLANLADEIGITVSQAQAYGIGVRQVAPGSGEFTASYGLTFSLLGSGSNKAYLFFADRGTPGNQVYGGDWTCQIGPASECLGRVDISRGNYIESLCTVFTSGPDNCAIGRVDISFARPLTEAQIKFFDQSGVSYNPANIKGAKINVRSPRGAARSVTVYQTGQISVQ